jgi:DNA-binding MarR family transcriptional regulator
VDYTDVLINIRKIIRSINLESKRIEKEHGISIPQYLCLNYIKSQDKLRASAKEIGQHLNLNPSTVTGIVSRLEKKAFVAKLPNEEDKRSVHIYLTALGDKVLSSIPDLLQDKLTQKLKELSNQDLASLQSSLDLLISFMGVENVEAAPVITPGENIIEKS